MGSRKSHAPEAIVTHTTARIRGLQNGHVSVSFARTNEAVLTLVWGGIVLRYLSADAAQGVLEGFVAARSLLIGLDNTAPIAPTPAAEVEAYGRPTVELTWIRRPGYAVVHHNAYSKTHQRTVHWVDLHMGPVTWQILDHVGFNGALEVLRNAHRTAVAVFLDGGKYRTDPTRDDYQSPSNQ